MCGGLQCLPDEGVGECKQHCNTNTDQECRVDKTCQQEHFGLQCVHQLGLTSRSFQIFTAHQSDTNASADSAKTNNNTASQSNEINVGHNNSLVKNRVIKKSKNALQADIAPRPDETARTANN